MVEESRRSNSYADGASLRTGIEDRHHLRNDLGRKQRMSAVVGVQAAQQAVLRGQAFGHGGPEVDQRDLRVRRVRFSRWISTASFSSLCYNTVQTG